ncbi:MAG: NAD/NADP octopine/nopaline dehydrogenase family protein [Clostridiales bacterium]|nr:NAD/NADP octopine/nopaline dehydrogenase family protein [Clostridiales bacterium]
MEQFKDYPKFAVIGAGNGGQAMAGHLSMMGFRVNLYNRTLDNIKDIQKSGGIILEGEVNGFGKLNLITDSMKDAVEDADIIMVTVPASGHKDVAFSYIPYSKDGQIVVLNPGRTGGALEFLNIMKTLNFNKEIILAEAQTFIYACRAVASGKVKIYSIKNVVSVASVPSQMTPYVISCLSHAYPQFTRAENVLETSLNNIGAVFHPAPTLLNCGRIESTKGDFQYYIDGITPTVAGVLEYIDAERISVAKAVGVNAITALEWLYASYGAKGNTLYDAIQNTRDYADIKAPPSLNTRYIFEDIPDSLVPISAIGQAVGVKTPTINSIIEIACVAHNRNYYASGRNTKNLGIEGLTKEQLMELVTYGEINKRDEVVA